MTRRLRIALIALVAVLLTVTVGLIGYTAAIWTGGGAASHGGGANLSSVDWNAWAKYFVVTEDATNGTTRQVLTAFHNDKVLANNKENVYGYNQGIVIIPKMCGSTPPTVIAAGLFKGCNDLPVTVVIPANIVEIDPAAFANLPNLKTIVFEGGDLACKLGAMAFGGLGEVTVYTCRRSLVDEFGRSLVDEKDGKISAASDAFKGSTVTLNTDEDPSISLGA